jgi:integrase
MNSKPADKNAYEAAISKLLQISGRKFQRLLGDTGQRFDDSCWDLRKFQKETVSSSPRFLKFTCFQSEKLLPPVYIEIVKCWLLLEYAPHIKTMWNALQAAKCLWEVLRQRQGEAFSWSNLSEADLNEFEVWLAGRYYPNTILDRMALILGLSNFLTTNNICRPLYYITQTSSPRDIAKLTIAGQEADRAKLPSPRALQGLADLYQQQTAPPDRLLLAAIAILVVTGLRVTELLTLPEDCEVQEMHQGRAAYGLRYYKEKAKGREKMFAVRWLTPLQAELAQKAIHEIRQLTARARERARELEANPERVPIPGYGPDDRVDSKTLAAIVGYKGWRPVRNGSWHELPSHKREGESRYHYLIKDVETFLLRYRQTPLWVIDRGDGTQQLLSETLLIMPRHFLNPRTPAQWLFVEPLRAGLLQRFLASGARMKSIFERLNICEEDGTPCRLTSHQFRHWLNDLADKGGMAVEEISRWMGRESRQETEVYRHATADERLAWVKQGIQDGRIQGALAGAYFDLPLMERDSLL